MLKSFNLGSNPAPLISVCALGKWLNLGFSIQWTVSHDHSSSVPGSLEWHVRSLVKCSVTPWRKFCTIPVVQIEKSGCRVHELFAPREVSGSEPRQPRSIIAFYRHVTGWHTEYIWHSPSHGVTAHRPMLVPVSLGLWRRFCRGMRAASWIRGLRTPPLHRVS